ncbi:MAG TPA: YggT family protein [Acidimicrobiia bacterium]|nr:YggT family protein [Acidimicrobiia bacterium]
MKSALCTLLGIYMLVLLMRAVMSWFPIRPGTPFATIYRVLLDVTEPVLTPLRRVIPPAGMFDLSFLVLFIGIEIVRTAVLRCPGALF